MSVIEEPEENITRSTSYTNALKTKDLTSKEKINQLKEEIKTIIDEEKLTKINNNLQGLHKASAPISRPVQ